MNDVTNHCSTILRDPARIAAVHRTGLLDTPAEEAFDRLTRLAARTLNTPIALISFLDEDRLFFKSSFGLRDPSAVRELPLAQTFCQNNVTLKQPLVIEDARKHALVCNHPAVEAFGVGGYLGVPLFDSAGHGLGILCVIDHQPRTWSADQIATLQDLAATVITEIELRVAAREAQAAREHVTILLESIPDGFVALDSEWRFTYVNAKAGQLLGMPQAELIGENHWQLFPALLDTAVETEYRRAMQNQVTVEFENYYTPWRRWFEIKAGPSADGGLSIFFHESSERKQIEAQARASAEQLRLITDAVPALISYVDKDGYYRLNNQAYETWFGHSRAEMTGRLVRDVLGENAWANVGPRIKAALAGQTVNYESSIPYKDGGTRWINATYTPHVDTGGAVAGIAVLVNDITERKRAEDSIIQQKVLFEALIESVLDGILIVSPEGKMLHFNQHFLDIWNFPPEVTQSQSDEVALQWAANQTADPAAFLARVADIYKHPERSFREELLMKDGRAYERFGAPIRSGDTRLGWVWTFRDITERKQVETALTESKEKYRTLFDSMDEGYCIIEVFFDPQSKPFDWRFIEVNPAFEINNGLVNATGKTIRELAPDIESKWFDIYGRVAQTGTPLRFEEHSAALGRWFSLYAFRVGAPEEAKVAVLFKDITERKRSEDAVRESEARFHALANNMSQLAWMTDKEGWIFWYNQRWFDYTGTTLEEMQGWGWQKVHHPEHVQRVVDKISHCFETGEIWEDTFPLRGADGNYRWFLSRAIPIYDDAGKVLRWFGTNTDITEQLQAEAQLKSYALQLERSNRELQSFTAVASHDLQEPLRKIQTFGDRLRTATGAQLNDQGLDYLARMQKAALRMQELINDLISFARVTSKAQAFVPVDLGKVAHTVISDIEMLIEETAGRVEIAELPTIDADPTQMRQLLQNLIGNALKFHKPGETPLIIISAEVVSHKSSAKICQLSVADNGIGFDEQYLDRIFTVFERLHGRSDYEGTGIGLAICQRIAEHHGGNITARSKPGHGANFIVSLPLQQKSNQY